MTPGRSDKPVIGLVGGVGSGKSTAADMLVELGCAKVDGDRIGHDLLDNPAVAEQIRRRFGGEVFQKTGAVDRKALARRVFDDPVALERLNAIMRPRIRAEIERQVAAAQADPDVAAIVLDAAILLEAGWDDIATRLVFVRSADDQRLDRVKRGRNWDEAQWQGREKSQFAIDRKAASCSDVLDNSSSVSCLHEHVRELFQRIVHPADPA
ncbi:MAG: dephospho-CoA kinase [Planctomycetota bacterium]